MKSEVDRIPGSLVFVGRLVPGKGVHVLLQALHQLKQEGIQPPLTVIGDGHQRAILEKLTEVLGLTGQVSFSGVVKGEKLVEVLNRHDIMVIPSVWNEPFGVVALEGAACGCYIVGTENGGLPEAIGNCGTVVPNNNADALANGIQHALLRPPRGEDFSISRNQHLERHTPEAMVNGYLAILIDARREYGSSTTKAG
ncbi:glycosyltransferase [Pseudarthrobacter sp902506025]|uniref:glycosyltransferase family 4 protein n=1 Tax=Pseudarthrobacter sp. 902506025 TaxID=3155291 RepID=UPI00344CD766